MRSESGFSLVECLTSLLLLGVGMAALGTMLNKSMSQDIYSSANRRMDLVAQAIIEDLKGQIAQLSFDEIKNVSLSNNAFTPMYQSDGQTGSVNWVDKRGKADGGYVYRWYAEDNLNSTVWGRAVRLSITVARALDTGAEGTLTPTFPNAGTDPENPDRYKYKVRICNFVVSN